ncbi:hypothetical protein QUF72_19805 [Desulfobacterales bacterium HSG2]|nr:hypothetical protein [Desulfobacterales bacterium HSG2]
MPRHGKTIRHGQFEIRETIRVCARRCRHKSGVLVTRRAESLARHIIPGRVVGYDVLVCVGLQRFFHFRQREEIRTALLREHGLSLSAGEVGNPGRLFLTYVGDPHNERAGLFQDAMSGDGGWPLHVDATGEDGRGTLLVAISGWRQWVPGAWKIPTERADVILPCLRGVVRQFGAPCAVMRDLGRAVTLAVNDLLEEAEPDIPVFACHQHFLSDIGTDLLRPGHGELRVLFRQAGARPKLRRLVREPGRKLGGEICEARECLKYWQKQTDAANCLPNGRAGMAAVRALAQWAPDFSADGTGLDFPFDRPHLDFHDRCATVHKAVDAFLCGCADDRKVVRALRRLGDILKPVLCEPFLQITRRFRARAKLFDELRDILRLFPNTSSGDRKIRNKSRTAQEFSPEELRDVQNGLGQFVTSLKKRRPQRGPAQDIREAIDLILRHIEDHGKYLWGHVIRLPEEAGEKMLIVERTNNIPECFFHGMKHNERRRSGRKISGNDFECLPPAAALVYNLNFPDYVRILCGCSDNLADAFATTDFEKRRKKLAGETSVQEDSDIVTPMIASASMPIEDRRIIRSEDMRRRIVSAANSRKKISMG